MRGGVFRPEDQLLFALTRPTFTDAHEGVVVAICRAVPIDWDYVRSVAVSHGVAPLIYVNLMRSGPSAVGVPSEVLEQLRLSRVWNAIRKATRAATVSDIVARLAQRSFDVMPIKGAALDAAVYTDPSLRISGDVDLVARRRDGKNATAADKKDLATIAEPVSWLELDYFEHHDVARWLDFGNIWEEATLTSSGGMDVWMMSPEDMLIMACVSSCRRRYLSLKMLCDIAELVARFDGVRWKRVAAKSRTYGCSSMVYTALSVAKQTMGCGVPDSILDDLGVDRTRRWLIDLLSHPRLLVRLDSVYSGMSVGGKQIGLALALPYATYGPAGAWRLVGQIGRQMVRESRRSRK